MLTFRDAVRTGSPKSPGVYGMVDGKGRLIYVGKAKELRTRLMSYCREKRDHKAGRILHAARTIVWERAPNEFAALLRELELIRRHRPRFQRPGAARFPQGDLSRDRPIPGPISAHGPAADGQGDRPVRPGPRAPAGPPKRAGG